MAENGKRVGTCLEMCPLSEMNERTRAGTLHEFEVKPETKREKFPTPIQSKVVKQFCRSSAGDILHREERLRPIHVLLKTMDYLVYEILTKKDVPWNLVYDFAFDRMRAIRQDMVIQQIGGSQKILIMERMVLFHLYAGYTLCEKPARLYDSVINETHIKECLQILLVHYSEQNSKAICRRPLFESMYLLYNLGSTDAMLRYGSLPKSLQQNSRIKRAFKMSLEYMNSNCYKVLATLKSLDIQELLAVHKNVKSAQRKLLSQIIQGFSSQTCKFPVDHFIKMMCPFRNANQRTGHLDF
ncbi:SAC3 domain-containing protein 1 [Halotydeus destructor]|nr:SAC3 domain-containing protein 1 [Halotydeus destructor]